MKTFLLCLLYLFQGLLGEPSTEFDGIPATQGDLLRAFETDLPTPFKSLCVTYCVASERCDFVVMVQNTSANPCRFGSTKRLDRLKLGDPLEPGAIVQFQGERQAQPGTQDCQRTICLDNL